MRKDFPVNCLLILFASILLTSQILFSQPVTQEWVKNYTGPSNDLIGPFLAVDKQGNSYLAGTHVINDTINILCAKYNTQGVQQWTTLYKYPGEGYFAPAGLALDSSGNAYVISRYGQTYLLPLNGLIVKFNSLNGNPVWAKKYIGDYGWSAFSDIEIDRFNNIFVIGWSDTSHLIIKYNTNGDSIWVRKYHPPSCREVSYGCTVDDSLNIIFTGKRFHYYPPYGSLDSVLVTKYSSGGALRWESTYANGISANEGYKVVADQNGNLYIGGVTTVSGNGVFLTLKYDRNGVRQWVKIYDPPGSGDNELSGIVVDKINNALFVTGNAMANGIKVAATLRYNPSTGDSIWVKKDTGIYSNGSSNDINVDSSGNIYITGSTYNNQLTMGGPMTIKYSSNGIIIWLVKYEGPGRAIFLQLDNLRNIYICGPFSPAGYILIKYSQLSGIKPLSNEVPQEFGLKQNFPNPFNSSTIIKFSIPKKSFVKIQVYDLLGRLTDTPVNEEIEASEYELRIDASKYSSGVYFYQMIADGNIVDTKKMVLIK